LSEKATKYEEKTKKRLSGSQALLKSQHLNTTPKRIQPTQKFD
jgi:hypothetical protein